MWIYDSHGVDETRAIVNLTVMNHCLLGLEVLAIVVQEFSEVLAH